eukprot:gene14312-20294_t
MGRLMVPDHNPVSDEVDQADYAYDIDREGGGTTTTSGHEFALKWLFDKWGGAATTSVLWQFAIFYALLLVGFGVRNIRQSVGAVLKEEGQRKWDLEDYSKAAGDQDLSPLSPNLRARIRDPPRECKHTRGANTFTKRPNIMHGNSSTKLMQRSRPKASSRQIVANCTPNSANLRPCSAATSVRVSTSQRKITSVLGRRCDARRVSVAAMPEMPKLPKLPSLPKWGTSLPGLEFLEGYSEVAEIRGVRLLMEAETPKVEYLVKWKDEAEDTW